MAERSGFLGRQENESLVAKLQRQNAIDLQRKLGQQAAIQKAMDRGDLDWLEGTNQIGDLWTDYGAAKRAHQKTIDETVENLHGIHGLFDKVKHHLFPPPPSVQPDWQAVPSAHKAQVPNDTTVGAGTPPTVSPGPISLIPPPKPPVSSPSSFTTTNTLAPPNWASMKPGRVAVRVRGTGQVGTIDSNDFDDAVFERMQ